MTQCTVLPFGFAQHRKLAGLEVTGEVFSPIQIAMMIHDDRRM